MKSCQIRATFDWGQIHKQLIAVSLLKHYENIIALSYLCRPMHGEN